MQLLTRQEKITVFLLTGVCIIGLGVLFYRNLKSSTIKPEVVAGGNDSREKLLFVYVDISGAVWRPGLYKLEKGARLNDLVEKAGLRPDADADMVNRASLLSDGEKIVIPVKGERPQRNETHLAQGRININLATEEELRKLPYIGEKRSRDIINYREAHGPFTSIEELKEIPGIGEGAFQQLKEFIVAE